MYCKQTLDPILPMHKYSWMHPTKIAMQNVIFVHFIPHRCLWTQSRCLKILTFLRESSVAKGQIVLVKLFQHQVFLW